MSIAMFAVFIQNLGAKNMYNTTESQKNIVNQCILILTQQLKKLEQARSRPGFAKGGMSTIGSLMDTPLMQPVPSLTSSTIKKLRTSFANGGFVDDDLHQIQYLIAVLEGGLLTPMEAKLLADLYEDLNKIQGGSK
jgi:hypothetical protein